MNFHRLFLFIFLFTFAFLFSSLLSELASLVYEDTKEIQSIFQQILNDGEHSYADRHVDQRIHLLHSRLPSAHPKAKGRPRRDGAGAGGEGQRGEGKQQKDGEHDKHEDDHQDPPLSLSATLLNYISPSLDLLLTQEDRAINEEIKQIQHIYKAITEDKQHDHKEANKGAPSASVSPSSPSPSSPFVPRLGHFTADRRLFQSQLFMVKQDSQEQHANDDGPLFGLLSLQFPPSNSSSPSSSPRLELFFKAAAPFLGLANKENIHKPASPNKEEPAVKSANKRMGSPLFNDLSMFSLSDIYFSIFPLVGPLFSFFDMFIINEAFSVKQRIENIFDKHSHWRVNELSESAADDWRLEYEYLFPSGADVHLCAVGPGQMESVEGSVWAVCAYSMYEPDNENEGVRASVFIHTWRIHMNSSLSPHRHGEASSRIRVHDQRTLLPGQAAITAVTVAHRECAGSDSDDAAEKANTDMVDCITIYYSRLGDPQAFRGQAVQFSHNTHIFQYKPITLAFRPRPSLNATHYNPVTHAVSTIAPLFLTRATQPQPQPHSQAQSQYHGHSHGHSHPHDADAASAFFVLESPRRPPGPHRWPGASVGEAYTAYKYSPWAWGEYGNNHTNNEIHSDNENATASDATANEGAQPNNTHSGADDSIVGVDGAFVRSPPMAALHAQSLAFSALFAHASSSSPSPSSLFAYPPAPLLASSNHVASMVFASFPYLTILDGPDRTNNNNTNNNNMNSTTANANTTKNNTNDSHSFGRAEPLQLLTAAQQRRNERRKEREEEENSQYLEPDWLDEEGEDDEDIRPNLSAIQRVRIDTSDYNEFISAFLSRDGRRLLLACGNRVADTASDVLILQRGGRPGRWGAWVVAHDMKLPAQLKPYKLVHFQLFQLAAHAQPLLTLVFEQGIVAAFKLPAKKDDGNGEEEGGDEETKAGMKEEKQQEQVNPSHEETPAPAAAPVAEPEVESTPSVPSTPSPPSPVHDENPRDL